MDSLEVETIPATSSSDELRQAGWTQGSLFQLPVSSSVAFAHCLEANGQPADAPYQTTESDHFIVVSHACDIVNEHEPYIEALLCHLGTTEEIRSVFRNSARWTLVSRETGLIVDARKRMVITKQCVERLTPVSAGMTDRELEWFRDWLGWRFTRPANDDDDVKRIGTPIMETIKRLEKSNAAELNRFRDAVMETRIQFPEHGMSNLVPLLVICDDMQEGAGLSAEQLAAVDLICDSLRETLTKNGYELDYQVRLYSETLLSEYEATTRLRLDYLSVLGNELTEPTGLLRNARPATPSS